MADVRPKFKIEKIEGTDEVEQVEYIDGKMTRKMVKMHRGWMVSFPRGHSVHIRTLAEMERLGFDKTPEFTDMETGDEVNVPENERTRKQAQVKDKPSAATGKVQAQTATD